MVPPTEASAAATERVIRVFVSSTFRDMGAEREELVKWAFPQLRKRCEERRVTWGEVDLRWGITDEQSAEGKVLPICLAEIRRCRPYFIGVLGERYGWVPDEIDPSLVREEPWLAEHAGHSITELEILHGVLNDPAMADHAFFYLRDPAYAESLPDGERRALLELPTDEEIERFGPEDAERRAVDRRRKLAALKERIRASGFPVDEYEYPEALAQLVLRDLGSVIDRLFPAGSEPESLDLEAAGHEAFARSRAAVYVGRPEILERLDRHVAGDGPPIAVLGESGGGKSALLANWALRWRAQNPDDLVVMHFIGGTRDSVDWAAMVRRISGELEREEGAGSDMPTDPDELKAAFADMLQRASERGRVVLVLDALNQLEDRDGAPDLLWLPRQLPDSIRVVCSTLAGRPLEELIRRGWPMLEVPPLEEDERRELIRRYLGQYTKELAAEHVDRIVRAPQSANPLFLSAMLEELRLWGDHDTLRAQIAHYLEAQAIDDLCERILARYEHDYERNRPGLVRDVMSLLWAARRGLSEAELLDLLGSDREPLPAAYWSPLYLAAERSLLNRAGLIGFSHDYLRQAVEDRYLPGERERREAHIFLANYFDGRRATPRGVDELSWQLTEGAQWPRLHALLVDLDYLEKLWEANEFEARSYWARLESGSDFRMAESYGSLLARQDGTPHPYWIVAALLLHAGHPKDAAAFYERLLEHARTELDYKGIQTAAGNQALIFRSQGRLDEAIALHREEERICRRFDDQTSLAVSLGHQALILRDWGRVDEAMELLEEQERICRELRYKPGLAVALGNRAGVLRDRGRLEEAIAVLDEADVICKELGDTANLERTLASRATILHDQGRLEDSMAMLQEQEQMCREFGHASNLAKCLGSQAGILQAWGRVDEAMGLLQQQERIYRELDEPEALQRSIDDQAAVLQGAGRVDEAVALLEEQERVCRQVDRMDALALALRGRALVLQGWGRLDEAMALLKEQEQICRELGDEKELNFCLGKQAVILTDRGRSREAFELLKRSEQIAREIGDQRGLQAAIGTQGQILQDWGRLDEAMSLLEEQERICREIGDKRGIGVAVGNQALVLRDSGRGEEAIALLEEEERISRELGDTWDLGVAVGNRGLVLRDLGRLEEALELFAEEERLRREFGDPRGVQSALRHRVIVLEDLERLEEAAAPLAQMEEMSRVRDDKANLHWALGHRAQNLAKQGRLDDALIPLDEKERICRELGDEHGLGDSLRVAAAILAKLGDSRGAIEKYVRFEQVCRERGDDAAAVNSMVARAVLELGLGERQTALETLDGAHDIAAAGRASGVEELEATIETIRRLL